MAKDTKIIAMYNAKGGVGKTTSSINVGYYLMKKGKKVLLIDIDPQGNLSRLAGLNDEDIEKTSLDILKFGEPIENTINHIESLGFDVISCNRNIVQKEEYMSIKTLKEKELTLRNAINNIKDNYDYIVIDCPPSLTELTVNALVAATDVLVPFKVDSFVFDGLSELINKINSVKAEFNEDLKLTGIFITMDTKTRVNSQVREVLKTQFEDLVFNTSIRNTSKVVESTFEYKPVAKYAPSCNASKDYLALTEELLERMA